MKTRLLHTERKIIIFFANSDKVSGLTSSSKFHKQFGERGGEQQGLPSFGEASDDLLQLFSETHFKQSVEKNHSTNWFPNQNCSLQHYYFRNKTGQNGKVLWYEWNTTLQDVLLWKTIIFAMVTVGLGLVHFTSGCIIPFQSWIVSNNSKPWSFSFPLRRSNLPTLTIYYLSKHDTSIHHKTS